MPDPIEIRIRIPDNLGLTPKQIAELKKKVKIEIVASTMPADGFTAKTAHRLVIQMINGNNIHR